MPIWPIWPNFEVNGLDWQCCLAGSSKTAPRIFISSIVLGAEYLACVKSIETHARAFLTLNILSIGTVRRVTVGLIFFFSFNIGGVLGNYAMKFEIQSGGCLNFCVALPFICFTF